MIFLNALYTIVSESENLFLSSEDMNTCRLKLIIREKQDSCVTALIKNIFEDIGILLSLNSISIIPWGNIGQTLYNNSLVFTDYWSSHKLLIFKLYGMKIV